MNNELIMNHWLPLICNILFATTICCSNSPAIHSTKPSTTRGTKKANGKNATTTSNNVTINHTSTNGTVTPTSNVTEYLMDVVYWEQKPFLFYNKKGEIDGIIPQLFEQASAYCLSGNTTIKINNYIKRTTDRKHFYELARSYTDYQHGELTRIRKNNAFWVPVVAYSNRKIDEFIKRRGLRTFQLMKSDKIAVIVRRNLISLPNKIIRGILSCQQIFFLAILMAILFGLTLWVIERYQNKELPTSFVKGLGTGLYWAIVSMTTVGYGDITPKNWLGRFIACIWLFVGVMVGCIMTATMTDVVTGVKDLNVLNKKVSVLEHSFEEKTAEKDYRANVVRAESYEQVLDLVRRGEVFAAMMNADVAAWYQDEIDNNSANVPLRIVEKLPANLYINCYLPADLALEMKNIFKCMYYAKDEVYTYSIEAFQQYCHTNTLYIGSMADLIINNIYIQILLGAVVGLMLMGIGYDMANYWLRTKSDAMEEREKESLMEKETQKKPHVRCHIF